MIIEFDYSKLRGRIREILGSERKFAEELELSYHTISKKLNGEISFKQKEILKVCDILKLEREDINSYFFKLKVQEYEQ